MSGEGNPRGSTTPRTAGAVVTAASSPTTKGPVPIGGGGGMGGGEVTPQPSMGTVKALFDAMESYPPSGNHEGKEARMVPNMFSTYDEMNNTKEKTELIPTTLYPGLTLATLWSTAFASSSNFWQTYKVNRGDTKMDMPMWNIDAANNSFGSRMYTCHAMVEGSPTPFFEAGRFAMARDLQSNSAKMCMHLSAQTPEVICGTTFRVEAVLNFEETPDGVTVRILGGCRKMAGRFSFIKGLAEPRACSEMKKGYVVALAQLKDTLPPPPSGAPVVVIPNVAELPSTSSDPQTHNPQGGGGSPPPSQLQMMLGGIRPEIVGLAIILLLLCTYIIWGGGSGALGSRTPLGATGSPSFNGHGGHSEDRMVEDLLRALAGSGSPSSHDSSSGVGSRSSDGNGHAEVLLFRAHLLEERMASLEWKLNLQYFVIFMVAAIAVWAKFS